MLYVISGVLCQMQVSRTETNNYIPQFLWDVITCPWPWYLLPAQHYWYDDNRLQMYFATIKTYLASNIDIQNLCIPKS